MDTSEIIKRFGLKSSDIVFPKYGNRKEIKLDYFLYNLVLYGQHTCAHLNMCEKTYSKHLRLFFGAKTVKFWHIYIFDIIECKRCYKCSTVKEILKFSKNADECKCCQNTYRNENKEHYSLYNKEYNKNNREARTATENKRRANKLKALPGWANIDKINLIYKLRPNGYHVDHIIPLQGELVCGLHIANNLQYLLAKENITKSNKYEISLSFLDKPIKYKGKIN